MMNIQKTMEMMDVVVMMEMKILVMMDKIQMLMMEIQIVIYNCCILYSCDDWKGPMAIDAIY
jgi:hypothetical protein